MKSKLRFYLIRLHFGALALFLINECIKYFTKFELAELAEFVVVLAAVISAIILFFLYRKPFARINYYFSLYVGTLSLIIATTFLNGFLGLILLHVLVLPLVPQGVEHRQGDIIFYNANEGFMSMCCTYQIKERYGLIFEKDLGTMVVEEGGPLLFSTVDLEINEREVILSYDTGLEELGIQTVIAPR